MPQTIHLLTLSLLPASTNSAAFDIPPFGDTPLAGGAWQSVPRDNVKVPIDQVRYFFRADPNTIGLCAWDGKKPMMKNFEVFPFPDSIGHLGYCMWHDGKSIQQRLFLQNKVGEIVELASPVEEHNWTTKEILPLR